jgi:hypothetical protein
MANLKISGNTPLANERLASEQINSAKTPGHALTRAVGTKSTDEPLGFSAVL